VSSLCDQVKDKSFELLEFEELETPKQAELRPLLAHVEDCAICRKELDSFQIFLDVTADVLFLEAVENDPLPQYTAEEAAAFQSLVLAELERSDSEGLWARLEAVLSQLRLMSRLDILKTLREAVDAVVARVAPADMNSIRLIWEAEKMSRRAASLRFNPDRLAPAGPAFHGADQAATDDSASSDTETLVALAFQIADLAETARTSDQQLQEQPDLPHSTLLKELLEALDSKKSNAD